MIKGRWTGRYRFRILRFFPFETRRDLLNLKTINHEVCNLCEDTLDVSTSFKTAISEIDHGFLLKADILQINPKVRHSPPPV